MYLSRLALTNYRNFPDLELALPAGMVFILGRNAQGKSNLLEAAYLLAIGKSYHANTDRELIHLKALEEVPSPGSGQALITGEVEHRDGRLKVIIGLQAIAAEGAGGPSIKAMVCSAAATVLPVGALTTAMPALVAASKSMLSTPMPARPTTCSFFAVSITSLVTLVSLRTTNPS